MVEVTLALRLRLAFCGSAGDTTALMPAPILPVVFALHDSSGSYWLNTAVAVSWVLAYASRPIHVHLLHDETLSEAARLRLATIASDVGASLTLTPVAVPAAGEARRLAKFSAASLYRLLIPSLFAGHEGVIYLDSDVVVNGLDVADLAAAAPPDAPVSAVRDPYLGRYRENAREMRSLGLDPVRYFNSGVLVIRPPMIEADLLSEFATFAGEHPETTHPDQNFLNWRFRDCVHLLEERFNYQVGVHEQRMFRRLEDYHGKILHYVGHVKPTNGHLAPGLLPFWIHAHRAPEVVQGRFFSPNKYLFGTLGKPNALSAVPVEQQFNAPA